MHRISATSSKSVATFMTAAILVVAPLVRGAGAQERPSPVVEFAAGSGVGADAETGGFLGGAGRFYVLPRISVGPEVIFSQAGRSPGDFMFSGNVTLDFFRSTDGQPRKVMPFAVAGGGVFLSRERFGTNTFTTTDGTFGGGGGLRVLMGKRTLAGAEARIGFLYFAFEGFVGVRLGI